MSLLTIGAGAVTGIVGAIAYNYCRCCCKEEEFESTDAIEMQTYKKRDPESAQEENNDYILTFAMTSPFILENLSWNSMAIPLQFLLTLCLGLVLGMMPYIRFIVGYIENLETRMEVYVNLKELGLDQFIVGLQALSAFIVFALWMLQNGSKVGFVFAAGLAALCVAPPVSFADAILSADQAVLQSRVAKLEANHLAVLICILLALVIHSSVFIYQQLVTYKPEGLNCCIKFSFCIKFLACVVMAFMYGSHTFEVQYMGKCSDKEKLELYVAGFVSGVLRINTTGSTLAVVCLISVFIISLLNKHWKWTIAYAIQLVAFVVQFLGDGVQFGKYVETLQGCGQMDCTVENASVMAAINYFDEHHPFYWVLFLFFFVVNMIGLIYFQNFMKCARALFNVFETYEGALFVWGVSGMLVGAFAQFDSTKFYLFRNANQVVHLLGDILVVTYHTGFIPHVASRTTFSRAIYVFGAFSTLLLMLPEGSDFTWQKFVLGHLGDTALAVVEFIFLVKIMSIIGAADSATENMMGRAVHGISLFAGRFFAWNTTCGYWAILFGLGTLYAVIVCFNTPFWTDEKRQNFAIRTRVESEKNWPKYMLLIVLICIGCSLQEYRFTEFLVGCQSMATDLLRKAGSCFCSTGQTMTYTLEDIAPTSTVTNLVWMIMVSFGIMAIGYNFSTRMFRKQKEEAAKLAAY